VVIYRKSLEKLETMVQVLRQDPQDLATLQAAYDEVSDLLAEQKRRCYALDQLVARLPHFAYQDAQDLPCLAIKASACFRASTSA
jgi:chromosome partition protein MukB